MSLREWLWSLLPDQCEVEDCCRKGTRGNENIVHPWSERYTKLGITMCDYCNSRYMNGEVLIVTGIIPMIARGTGVVQSFDEAHRRKKREDES